MHREHKYSVDVVWTGNTGEGTANYRSYTRDHEIKVPGKPPLKGSSDPKFQGDPSKYNPEELLVSALSSCHMLWYLHLCANAGVVVISYQDRAEGTMEESSEGAGCFVRVTLHPHVRVTNRAEQAEALHQRAHKLCFIANSVNFPVLHQPITELQTA